MTNRLDELRGLLDQATPGPWRVDQGKMHLYNPSRDIVDAPFIAVDDPPGAVAVLDMAAPQENAALIVFLRNHAEDLLAVCRAAEGVIGTYRQDRLPDASGVWAELRNALARLSPPSEGS